MNCRDTRSRLSEYIDGELSAERRDAVRQHLEQCVECRQVASRLGRTVILLRAMDPVVPPATLADAVRKRISAGRARPAPLWAVFSHPAFRIGAAACLVAAVGLYALIESGSPPSSSPARPGSLAAHPVAAAAAPKTATRMMAEERAFHVDAAPPPRQNPHESGEGAASTLSPAAIMRTAAPKPSAALPAIAADRADDALRAPAPPPERESDRKAVAEVPRGEKREDAEPLRKMPTPSPAAAPEPGVFKAEAQALPEGGLSKRLSVAAAPAVTPITRRNESRKDELVTAEESRKGGAHAKAEFSADMGTSLGREEKSGAAGGGQAGGALSAAGPSTPAEASAVAEDTERPKESAGRRGPVDSVAPVEAKAAAAGGVGDKAKARSLGYASGAKDVSAPSGPRPHAVTVTLRTVADPDEVMRIAHRYAQPSSFAKGGNTNAAKRRQADETDWRDGMLPSILVRPADFPALLQSLSLLGSATSEAPDAAGAAAPRDARATMTPAEGDVLSVMIRIERP